MAAPTLVSTSVKDDPTLIHFAAPGSWRSLCYRIIEPQAGLKRFAMDADAMALFSTSVTRYCGSCVARASVDVGLR